MALRLSSAARLANPSFGNIEQLGQDIGSLSARRRQRGMLTDLLSPLTDPMATSADYATAARGLIPIDQGLGLQVAAAGRTLAEQEEAKRLSEEQATTQRGLQGGLAAITQAAMRRIPLSDLTEATGSILRLGGTNQQIIDAYEAGTTDPSEKFSVVGNRVFNNQTEQFVGLPEAAELLPLGTLEKVATPESVIKYAQTRDPSDLVPKSADDPAEAPQQIKDQLDAVDRDLASIDKLIGMDDKGEYWKFGYSIASSEYNPLSTDAKSVKGFVTQIQAGLAFDELKKMRQESKTGGALGSVSNIEINLLQSAIAALDPSAPNFGDQLKVVRQHYQNFKDAVLGREPSSGTNYRKIDGTLYYIDPNEVGSDGKAKVYNLNNIASSVAAGQRVAVPTPFSYELEANFSQEGQE